MELNPPDVGGFDPRRVRDDDEPGPGLPNRGRPGIAARESSPAPVEPASRPGQEDAGRRPGPRRAAGPDPATDRPSPAESRPNRDSRALRTGDPTPAPSGWGQPRATSGGSAIRAQRTVQFEGVDVRQLRGAQQFLLQIYGKDGGWHRFKSFDANGVKIGSRERSEDFPQLRTMGARHLRLTPQGSRIVVEDLDSLNGVFRRITQSHPLTDGTRFRIGQYLIEFRIAGPIAETPPLCKDGEQLTCIDPVAHAVLVFIRPDGRDGWTFPLTKINTVLGQERGGPTTAIDIHLPAERTSARHAEVIRTEGGYVLENRSETNGTFVQIRGADRIKLNEEILAGEVKFRVVRDSG
jgi:pSer/pThr/pTyr-binding forkhead associated (FHA) protein